MLVTIITVGLSGVLASIVAGSLLSTRADMQTLRAVDAAHAGLDAGLARVMKLGVAPMSGTTRVIEGAAKAVTTRS